MTLPQDHIANLNDKVDMLHSMVEQLSDRLSTLVPEKRGATSNGGGASDRGAEGYYPNRIRHSFDEEIIGHKDVLSEEDYLVESERVAGDQVLSSEVQVQRLTAQLTAAYNRIAALEEQLLSQRIH